MENNKEAINTTLIAALFRFETFVNKKDKNELLHILNSYKINHL